MRFCGLKGPLGWVELRAMGLHLQLHQEICEETRSVLLPDRGQVDG